MSNDISYIRYAKLVNCLWNEIISHHHLAAFWFPMAGFWPLRATFCPVGFCLAGFCPTFAVPTAPAPAKTQRNKKHTSWQVFIYASLGGEFSTPPQKKKVSSFSPMINQYCHKLIHSKTTSFDFPTVHLGLVSCTENIIRHKMHNNWFKIEWHKNLLIF